MLSARNRLERQEGFSNTMRLGSRAGSRALVVYLWNPSLGDGADATNSSSTKRHTKAGVVVGKRQIPRAVDRNLVKRRLRHLLAERISELEQGSRIVVRALSPSLDMTYGQLGDALDSGIRRAERKHEANVNG